MTTTKLLSLTLLLVATMGVCGVSSAEEVKDSTSTQIVSAEDSDLRNEEALRVAVGDFDDVEFLLSADEMAKIADNAYVSLNDISAQGGEGSGTSMFSAEASERVETTQSASSSFNGALTLAPNTSETVTVRQSAVATTSLSFDDSTEQSAEELQSLDKGRDGVGTLISSDDSGVSKETVSFLGNFDSVGDGNGSYGISTLSNGGDIKPFANYDSYWNGTDSDNIWDTSSSNKNWIYSGNSDYWVNSSGNNNCNAIFDGRDSGHTVIVGASIVATNLTVTGGGEYTFEYSEGASLTANGTVTIGNASGAGSLTINGGTNTFTGNTIYVGYQNTGLLTINGGTNTFGSADKEIDIGWDPSGGATGTLKITGGENTFSAGTIYLGRISGDTGTIEITGGTVDFKLSSSGTSVPTSIYVGMGGTGEIIIGSLEDTGEGPTVTFQAGSEANTKLYLGYSNSSSGKITINSGTTKFDSSVDLYVGEGTNTTGAIEINGGKTTFDTAVYLGHGTSSKGTLTITGGDNKFNEAVYIGYTNTGSLTISGGTNTFDTVYGGRLEGGTSTNGTMTVTDGYTTVKTLSVNNGQTTSVSGGTLVVTNLEQNSSSTLNVTEGTVVLGTLSQADNSGLNISGGSVEITTSTSGANGAYIKASGSGKLILDVAVTGDEDSTGKGLTIEFKDNSTLVIQGGLLDSIVEAAGDYVAVLQAETIYFREYLIQYTGEVPELNDDLINGCVYAGGYTLTWKYDENTHILSAAIAAPEPSMFGLMLGLGAIGLVATRRRQRAA